MARTATARSTLIDILCSRSMHCVFEIFIVVDVGDSDDFLGTEVAVVDADGDGAAVMNGRIAGNDFFNVLGINIFAADDDQIFLWPMRCSSPSNSKPKSPDQYEPSRKVLAVSSGRL
jgi:hypothetical protein